MKRIKAVLQGRGFRPSFLVTKSHRAVAVLSGDTVTWFWIGDHDEYEAFYS